jgi:hypothetical protein
MLSTLFHAVAMVLGVGVALLFLCWAVPLATGAVAFVIIPAALLALGWLCSVGLSGLMLMSTMVLATLDIFVYPLSRR